MILRWALCCAIALAFTTSAWCMDKSASGKNIKPVPKAAPKTHAKKLPTKHSKPAAKAHKAQVKPAARTHNAAIKPTAKARPMVKASAKAQKPVIKLPAHAHKGMIKTSF